jgi:alpha-ribazole phosphatase
MSLTTIDLLRHGEPVGGRRYRGQTDDPLSEQGWRQMWAAVGETHPWSRIVSSPLSRCADFARELAKRADIRLTIDDRLMEVAFGEWEGRQPEELIADDPDRLFDFKRDPVGLRPPGAESLLDFLRRVSAALDDAYGAYEGGHILMVCHAGVIRMALARVLGVPLAHVYRIHVANSGITRIVRERRGDKVLETLVFHGGKLA